MFISLINSNHFYLFIFLNILLLTWVDTTISSGLMARMGHFIIGMHDAKKICVRLFFSVIICVIVIIIFSTFFIQMSTTHLNTYPWTTSTANRYNGRPTSLNTNKQSSHYYPDAYWDSSTPSTKGINKDSGTNCCCSDSYWDTLAHLGGL